MKKIFLMTLLTTQFFTMTAFAAGTMTCKGRVVTQVFTVGKDQIEIESFANGRSLKSVQSISDLKDGVLYLGDSTMGNAFDLENCKMAEYRGISGVAGAAGFRILNQTLKSCVCN